MLNVVLWPSDSAEVSDSRTSETIGWVKGRTSNL